MPLFKVITTILKLMFFLFLLQYHNQEATLLVYCYSICLSLVSGLVNQWQDINVAGIQHISCHQVSKYAGG